jgi:hypothetical protein
MNKLPVEKQINELLDLHDLIYDAEVRLGLVDHRSDYMRYLVELTLLEHGHSLEGMMYLSSRNKGYKNI